MTRPPVSEQEQARELAEQVLEAMSQDSGPADCEPWTGWAVDLARAVLGLTDGLDDAT